MEIDSLTKFSIRPAINVNDGFSERTSTSERIDNNRELQTNTFDSEDLTNKQFSNRLNFIRKFGKRGAYLEFNFTNQNEVQTSENFFFSELAEL